MDFIRSARTFSGLCSLLLFAACGGGGGGASADPSTGFNPPPTPTSSPQPSSPGSQSPDAQSQPTMPSGSVTLETNSVTFATSTRFVTPPERSIAVTLDGVPEGTPSYRVQINGNAVAFAEVLFTNGTGSLRIVPEDATKLDIGVNTGTITVSICIDDPFCAKGLMVGQPQTINVTYTVTASVQGDVVSPRVAAANQPGDVIIRGRGFSDATSVHFGTVAASAITVVSDSEIRASYPALAAGSYPVSINSGSIAFTGEMTVVNVPAYAAATLDLPADPVDVGGLLYDPERNALLVAVRYDEEPGNNQLIRFTYSAGQWSPPVSVSVPGIRDVVFSPDGSTLLVATDQALVEYDPSNLTAGASYALPTVNGREVASPYSLAIANDGYAVVGARAIDGSAPAVYLYSTQDHTFMEFEELIPQTTPVSVRAGADASGSFVPLMPFFTLSSVRGPMSAPLYDASAQRFRQLDGVPSNPNGFVSSKPALDRGGSLSVLHTADFSKSSDGYNFSTVVVYDNRSQQKLGRLPDSTVTTVLNADATRAYTLNLTSSDSNPFELRTYDLTQQPVIADAEYPQIGTGVPLNLERSLGPFAMIATPDGRTLFIAGTSGVIVQPTP